MIPARLLNKRITIRRNTKERTASGDKKNIFNDIAVAVPMRISRAIPIDKNRMKESGSFSSTSHRAFSNTSYDIQKGDIFLDTVTGEEYNVVDPNFIPGGETDHHYETQIDIATGT